VRPVEAVGVQRREQRLLEREADAVEVRRMLGLRIDADAGAFGKRSAVFVRIACIGFFPSPR